MAYVERGKSTSLLFHPFYFLINFSIGTARDTSSFWLFWRYFTNSKIFNFWFGDFFSICLIKQILGFVNHFPFILRVENLIYYFFSPLFGRCSWYYCNLISNFLSSFDLKIFFVWLNPFRSQIKFLIKFWRWLAATWIAKSFYSVYLWFPLTIYEYLYLYIQSNHGNMIRIIILY